MSTANITEQTAEPAEKSRLEDLKENSLKTSGYAYLVGDAALFASGMMAGRSKEAVSGLLYTAGSIACARYGNPSAEKQLEQLSQRLGHYLKKQGVEIPKDPTLESLTKEGGVIQHIESFLYAYPSQVFNAFVASAGAQLAMSGMQHKKGLDTLAGSLVTTGALAGLLIPEKKPDPEHPATTATGKAWEWVQEKPLRVPGIMYGLNNLALIASAYKEMKDAPAQKSYLFKFLTAASYMFANAMLTISSKDHAHGNGNVSKAMEGLGELSAKVIAAQPAPLQEALVEQISGYLASQPEVKMKAEDISALLKNKLAQQAKAPRGAWQQRAQEAFPGASPAL